MGVGKKGKQNRKGQKKGGGKDRGKSETDRNKENQNSFLNGQPNLHGNGSKQTDSGGLNSVLGGLGLLPNAGDPMGTNFGGNQLDAHTRVERAQPFWESLDQEQRRRMLTIPLNTLLSDLDRAAASSAATTATSSGSNPQDGESDDVSTASSSDQTTATSVLGTPSHLKAELERGLRRLRDHGTWKAWITWDSLRPQTKSAGVTTATKTTSTEADASAPTTEAAAAAAPAPEAEQEEADEDRVEFHDGEEFRQYLQRCYPPKLLEMLIERDWNSKMEFEAETQLRLRMQDLLQRVHRNNVQLPQPVSNGGSGAGAKENCDGGRGDANGVGGGGEGGKAGSSDREMLEPLGANTGGSRRMKLSKRYASRNDHLSNIRSNQVELITMMLEALEHEHELLYHAFLFPVTEFVCEKLDPDNRESSREELFFEDLDKLSLEDIGKICEFLTEKIDGLSSRMKPSDGEEGQQQGDKGSHGAPGEDAVPQENGADSPSLDDDDEGMGDVDLFLMDEPSAEKAGAEEGGIIVVNPKWLQHLEERCLSEDGHPMKMDSTENEHKVGLVLDWVYGSIVSTAEKSRAAAGIQLGRSPTSIEETYDTFIRGLMEQYQLETKNKKAKWFLEEMVQSRKYNQELTEQLMEMQSVDLESGGNKMVSSNPGEDLSDFLPDHVICEMLKREDLLTGAKLFWLYYEHENSDKKLRNVRAQLRQTEPEFERLKNELEELKTNPRAASVNHSTNPSEGAYRNQAEMERHRAQLQDAAIEEQIEVQTAFREQGVQLKMLFDKKRQVETEINHRDNEIKQLQGWKRTIETLVENFRRVVAEKREAKEGDLPQSQGEAKDSSGGDKSDASAAPDQATLSHEKRRAHFHREIRRQLYTEKEDRYFFIRINGVLKELEKRIDTGCAALSHMETIIVNLACDDPGALVGTTLLLPKHQYNIDVGAEEYMQKKAKEAEDEILRLEVEQEMKKLNEREKKQKKRNKQKEKLQMQREKAKEESERKERELKEVELRKEREAEAKREQERRERERLIEMRRKMEEEVIERRRAELLGEDSLNQAVASVDLAQEEAKGPANIDDGFTVVEKKKKNKKTPAASKKGSSGDHEQRRNGTKRSEKQHKERNEPALDKEEWPPAAPAVPLARKRTASASPPLQALAHQQEQVASAPPPSMPMESRPPQPQTVDAGGMTDPPQQLAPAQGPNPMMPPPPPAVPYFGEVPGVGPMFIPPVGMQPGMMPPVPYYPGPMPMPIPMPMPMPMPMTPQVPMTPLNIQAQPFKPKVGKAAQSTEPGVGPAQQDKASAKEEQAKEEPCPCGMQNGPCM